MSAPTPPPPRHLHLHRYKCTILGDLAGIPSTAVVGRPYFFRQYLNPFRINATKHHRPDDVTLAVGLSVADLPALGQLARFWSGLISAAIHVCESSELVSISEFLRQQPNVQKRVVFHLVVAHVEYIPMNTLRNVALNSSTTKYTISSNVHLMPSAPMSVLTKEIQALLRSGDFDPSSELLVLPAIQYQAKQQSDPILSRALAAWPLTKSLLRELVDTKRCILPSANHIDGLNQRGIDLNTWATSSLPTLPFELEPHAAHILLGSTETMQRVPFDERFIGRNAGAFTQSFKAFAKSIKMLTAARFWLIQTSAGASYRAEKHRVDSLVPRKTAMFYDEISRESGLVCDKHPVCWWEVAGHKWVTKHPLKVKTLAQRASIKRKKVLLRENLGECTASALLSGGHELPRAMYVLTGYPNSRVAPVLSGLPTDHDSYSITLTTQLTPNRVAMLEATVAKWRGPVSAVAHVCDAEDLQQLWTQFDASPILSEYVSLHILVGRTSFIPINTMRNFAMDSASTAWVLVVDVDAAPSQPMEDFSIDLRRGMLDTLAAKQHPAKVAFVVPAFEFSPQGLEIEANRTSEEWPISKERLFDLYSADVVRQMHYKLKGYRIPFSKWFTSQRRSLTIPYLPKAEHYIIGLKDSLARFDEKFIGRGYNKLTFTFELYFTGTKFRVLSSSWVMDTPHDHLGVQNQRNDPLCAQKVLLFMDDLEKRYSVDCGYGLECWWRSLAIEWSSQAARFERHIQLAEEAAQKQEKDNDMLIYSEPHSSVETSKPPAL